MARSPSVSDNPIQSVLDADADAQRQLEVARRDAEAALTDARIDAKHIVERNERRTQVAVRRFESACAEQLAGEIVQVKARAEAELDARAQTAAAQLEEIVTRRFEAFWPPADPGGGNDTAS